MITATASAFDAPELPRHFERLEQRAARFRTIYWLRDASTHGHANSILDAYHAQHELPERFAAVLSEIADLGRIVQGRDAQRIGAALGVLMTFGLPFGAALETLQVLNANSVRDLAIALGIALGITSGLLTTRVGRLTEARPMRNVVHGHLTGGTPASVVYLMGHKRMTTWTLGELKLEALTYPRLAQRCALRQPVESTTKLPSEVKARELTPVALRTASDFRSADPRPTRPPR